MEAERSRNPPNEVIGPWGTRELQAGNTKIPIDQILIHVQNLNRKLEILPRVDQEGGSDCPFAEDLFAQKEEAAAALREDLSGLLAIKRELEEELGRCESNLGQVGLDRGRLRTHPALEGYDAATQELIRQSESIQRQLDTIVMLIEIISAALKRADRDAFPRRVPRRSVGPTPIRPHPNSVGPMVDDMFSLGPTGRGGGTFGGWAQH